ncbi:MAG: hypothetical protein QME79_14885 [Bacillota bacterium]|nr:hypothetical protein [Bacillota bacterium]
MKTKASRWPPLIRVLGVVLLIMAGGAIAPARGESPAWDLEAGYQLSPEPAPYVSARVNLSLGELGPVGLWLLPEGGIVLGDPPDWYGRVQVLADLPWFTAGGEVRTGNVLVTRVFVRFGL